MGKKTPPCEAYPEWTSARFKQFIRSALRSAWNRWPPKYNVLNNNRKVVKGKRHKYEYKCADCKKWFKQREVQVDHIKPVGSFIDWNTLIEKMFVSEDELQILCKECHKGKTNEERRVQSGK